MATRAERYKAEKERSGPKKPPSPVRKAKPAKEAKETPAAEPKKKAPARRVEGSEHTAERNVSKRASKKAVSAADPSSCGRYVQRAGPWLIPRIHQRARSSTAAIDGSQRGVVVGEHELAVVAGANPLRFY